jgi:hypothetical protein
MTQDKNRKKKPIATLIWMLPPNESFSWESQLGFDPISSGVALRGLQLTNYDNTLKRISMIHRPRSITIKIERLKNK